jgi:hypothetical protein
MSHAIRYATSEHVVERLVLDAIRSLSARNRTLPRADAIAAAIDPRLAPEVPAALGRLVATGRLQRGILDARAFRDAERPRLRRLTG